MSGPIVLRMLNRDERGQYGVEKDERPARYSRTYQIMLGAYEPDDELADTCYG